MSVNGEGNSKPLGYRAVRAARWSLLTQVTSKLISPLTTLILARILTPEAFGIAATVAMVTALAEVIADGGFQKYIVQHEFVDDEDYSQSTNSAFWTNFVVSMTLWAVLVIWNEPIASLVGNDGMGLTIIAAGASLPFLSLMSIQKAIYQRTFDFRTLFRTTTGSAMLVLLVSVPLAAMGMGYWAIIIGTLCSNLFRAVWMTFLSSWKPAFIFSFTKLREMFSFSSWTLVESLTLWLTGWSGTLILGTLMNTYHLGLYKTSVSLVSAATGVVSSAMAPILFASLSRIQSNRKKFDHLFYLLQSYLAIVLVPISVAIFVFRDTVVQVLLGSQWTEAATFVGLYAAATSLFVVFGSTCAEAYRASGNPKYSVLSQTILLAVTIPVLIHGAHKGWDYFSVVVPISWAIGGVGGNFLVSGLLLRLSPGRMIWNQRWIYFVSLVTGLVGFGLTRLSNDVGINILFLGITTLLYLGLAFLIKDTRGTLLGLLEKFGLLGLRRHHQTE